MQLWKLPAAVLRPCRTAHTLNAVHQLRKVLRRAVNGVRLTRIGENLVSGDDLHPLLRVCLPLLIRLEQVIERGQTDVF